MLKSIYIKNYAIINEININFDKGLNIITGPSGSGKTLIVRAISFLTGSSLDKKFVSLDNTVIEGVCFEHGKKYTLRRVFNLKSTKNYINDEPVRVSEYKKFASKLIDINNQQEKYKLLDEEHHIEVLDSFANSMETLNMYREAFSIYSQYKNKLISLNDEKIKLREMHELYTYQIDELNQFNISETDERKVFKKLKKSLNQKEVSDKVELLENLISSGMNSLSTSVEKIKSISSSIKEYDGALNSIDESIRSISIEINEISNELNRYDSSSSYSSDQIEELEKQSSFYETIKRKYGGTLEAAVNYKTEIANKLHRSKNIDLEIEKLRKHIKDEEIKLLAVAKELQKQRFSSKSLFLKKVEMGLESLNMKDVEFDLKFKPSNELTNYGLETCEFFISFNRGVSKLPLKDVASGGELSRIVLIIKNISTHFNTPIIFDEIDSGVSGEIADDLGRLLLKISNKSQVVCVTHLPQVASKGHTHFYITKDSEFNKTALQVRKLSEQSRINEIAKMISGDIVQESGLEHAKNILKN